MFTEMELHHIYTAIFGLYTSALDMDNDGVVTYVNTYETILNKIDDHFGGK